MFIQVVKFSFSKITIHDTRSVTGSCITECDKMTKWIPLKKKSSLKRFDIDVTRKFTVFTYGTPRFTSHSVTSAITCNNPNTQPINKCFRDEILFLNKFPSSMNFNNTRGILRFGRLTLQ